MRTLADMTEEERAECVGMWCENEDGYPCVYMGDHISRAWLGICAYPRFSCTQALALGALIPRFDLPRAWAPDGQPPVGEWEHEYTGTDGCSLTTGEHVPSVVPLQEIRRFVGEWEKA